MFFDKNLTARSEKRVPVIVLVRLSALEAGSGEVEEKTYTDNLSSRGGRVCSVRNWQPGIKWRLRRSMKEVPSKAWLFIARSLTTPVFSLASSSIAVGSPGAFCSGRKAAEETIP